MKTTMKSPRTKAAPRAKRLPLVELPPKRNRKPVAATQRAEAKPLAKASCRDEMVVPGEIPREAVQQPARPGAEDGDAAKLTDRELGGPPLSAETTMEVADEGGGPDEDGAGVDPTDGRAIEAQLEQLMSRLTDDMSELAKVKLLPLAKKLYEELHPETKHGGVRDQVTKNGTCPPFVEFVHQRSGIATSTIYNKLEKATELEALDGDAEHLCYGSPLANKIGLLVRIARIPQKELHRDLVNIYRAAGPKKAKQELAKWEEELGLQPKPKPDLERMSNDDSKSGDVDRDELSALLKAHVELVKKIQKFLFGMPVEALMGTLTQLTGEQITRGKVVPEDLNVLIFRRALCTRVESLRSKLKTEGDVAPTAAKKFKLDMAALDKANKNPKLRVADVAALEEAWARAVAHVNATSPIEQLLAHSTAEAAS